MDLAEHLPWIAPLLVIGLVAVIAGPAIVLAARNRSGSIAPRLAALVGGRIGTQDSETHVTGTYRGRQVRIKLFAVSGGGTATLEMMLPRGSVAPFGGWKVEYDKEAARKAQEAHGVWAERDNADQYFFVSQRAPHVVIKGSTSRIQDVVARWQRLPEPLREHVAALLEGAAAGDPYNKLAWFTVQSELAQVIVPISALAGDKGPQVAGRLLEAMAHVAALCEAQAAAQGAPAR